jgi:hypothetical protein
MRNSYKKINLKNHLLEDVVHLSEQMGGRTAISSWVGVSLIG